MHQKDEFELARKLLFNGFQVSEENKDWNSFLNFSKSKGEIVLPSVLRTFIFCLCASMICLTIGRPNPVLLLS